MPLYEHVLLARQDISAQQVESIIETFQAIITDGGGTIGKSEYWGLKGLAYKIKKNRKAHFALFNIEAPHDAVAEMERQMRLSTDVIRFLTLRVAEHDNDPSPIMKRGDRDDRRGGRRDRVRGERDRPRDQGPRGGISKDARKESAEKPADGPADAAADKGEETAADKSKDAEDGDKS